jgi:hypothetical protein
VRDAIEQFQQQGVNLDAVDVRLPGAPEIVAHNVDTTAETSVPQSE